MTFRGRVLSLLTRLTTAPARIGWTARRILGWTEPRDLDALYRLFLGRSADPHEIGLHLRKHWLPTVAEFESCDERAQLQERLLADRILDRIASFSVRIDASPEELEVLFRQTQGYWRTVGSDEQTAYWSVLTSDDLRDAPTREKMFAFYESGRPIADSLVRTAESLRPGFRLPNARVLDFGCGLGRVLRHFVGEAAHCEGWDFSQPHLDLLHKNLTRDLGLDTDSFSVRLVDSLDFPQPDTGFDLVYSLLVLQHNPPPLMAYFLRHLLRTLAPGGIALIHVPTARTLPGYSFSMEDYSSERPRDMEMHALPRAAILRIADEEDVHILWSEYRHWCGPEALSELIAFGREHSHPASGPVAT